MTALGEALVGALVGGVITGGGLWTVGRAIIATQFVPKNRLFDANDRPLYLTKEEAETICDSRYVARSRLFDANDRPLFPTRDEINGISIRRDELHKEVCNRLDRGDHLLVSLSDRMGDVDTKMQEQDGKLQLMEERQTHQWAMIAKDMLSTADTVKAASAELRSISERQNRLALRFERRFQESLKQSEGT